MVDYQTFDQSNLSTTGGSRPNKTSRGRNSKKSLIYSNVYSLRDLLPELVESVPYLLHLEAYKYPSKYTKSKVVIITYMFGMSHPYRVVAPGPNAGVCYLKLEVVCLFKETFYAGFRLPAPPFIFHLLIKVRVFPTQLQPNA